jgi:hypothetical protein
MEPPDPQINVSERLPRPGQWVLVITPSFRCMGFVDEKGTWRDFLRKEPIEGVQAWSRISDEETARLTRDRV